MDFGLSPDQVELQAYARGFLTKQCPPARVREAVASPDGFDAALWKQMAELGWMSFGVPESSGGQQMSYVDLMLLVEETGRALVPGPFFSCVALGAPILAESGATELLPLVASGEHRVTLAWAESSGRLDPADVQTLAGPGARLSGTKRFVPDAHLADTIVVAARTGHGIGLFAVEASDTRIEVLDTMDATRRWCHVVLDDVPGRLICEDGWPVLERTLLKAISLLAGESVGGASQVLEMSTQYAKTREQFGQPIGTFQAVKHAVANMLVDVEMARSAAWYAAFAAASDPAELAMAASCAKALAGEAFTRVAASGIQVHGGIGFTWEADLHLYYKRAKANEVFLGDPAYHRDRVARLLVA